MPWGARSVRPVNGQAGEVHLLSTILRAMTMG